jgi:multicomponent Na+:H+ antiporter subunit D
MISPVLHMVSLPFASAAVPPAALLVLGAVGIALTRGHVRGTVAVLAALLTAWAVWLVPDGDALRITFIGYDIAPVSGSPVQRLFALTFTLTTLLGGLFAYRHAGTAELSAAYLYAAAAVGASLAGDLISVYLYLQLMLVASTAVILANGHWAVAAGLRYAVMMLLAGILLKLGIEGVKAETGTIALQPLGLGSPATWLLLAGLLIHAAAPPVSAWLSDAYTNSSPTGTMFLTMFTTKIAVLLLVMLFPGADVLLWLGLVMIAYGIVYGVVETDVRRLLCFALVVQLGFMLCAIAVGSAQALNGAVALAVTSTLYLTLSFMCAATAMHFYGARSVAAFGSAVRRSSALAIGAVAGALALSALPLTAGFGALPEVIAAAGEHRMALMWLLPAGHAGLVLFAAAKLLGATDREPESSRTRYPLPLNVTVALVTLAIACLVPGIAPGWLFAQLPHDTPPPIYAGHRILLSLAVPAAGAAVFVLTAPWVMRRAPIGFDTDWLWRSLLFRAAADGLDALSRARARAEAGTLQVLRRTTALLRRHGGDDGLLARPWAAGTTVLWVVVLLTGYAIVYYL